MILLNNITKIMVKLCKADEVYSVKKDIIRVKSFKEIIHNSSFSFVEEIRINQNGYYQKKVIENGYLILFTLENDIRLDMNGYKWKLDSNQTFVYYLAEGNEFSIEGSARFDHSEILVMFLKLEFEPLEKVLVSTKVDKENRLKKIIRHNLFNVYFGKYGLSKKGELPLKSKDRCWTVFPLLGDFEIYGQYLEAGKILQIYNNDFIAYESLATESLIIAIEY